MNKKYLQEVRCKDAYRITFHVGVNNSAISLICWKDDGTSGKHITVEFNNIPVGTFPIINNDGLRRLIISLISMYKTYNGNIDDLKELLNES